MMKYISNKKSYIDVSVKTRYSNVYLTIKTLKTLKTAGDIWNSYLYLVFITTLKFNYNKWEIWVDIHDTYTNTAPFFASSIEHNTESEQNCVSFTHLV